MGHFCLLITHLSGSLLHADSQPGEDIRFIPVEDMIGLYLHKLFPDFKLLKAGSFRLIRDSVVEVDEEAEDLVRTFESALKRRRRG